jgi:hypothetical protein
MTKYCSESTLVHSTGAEPGAMDVKAVGENFVISILVLPKGNVPLFAAGLNSITLGCVGLSSL